MRGKALKPIELGPGRVLVMMPGRLSDAVQATAMLRAIHAANPDTSITALIKRRIRPVLWGIDNIDHALSVRRRRMATSSRKHGRDRVSLVTLGRRLSKGNFDTAIILPESFRSAALAAVAGIPRRVGFENDGRGVLLTDRLVTRRSRGVIREVNAIDKYLGIANYLGAAADSARMIQRVSPLADRRLDAAFLNQGLNHDSSYVLFVGSPTSKIDLQTQRDLTRVLSEESGVIAASANVCEPRRKNKQGVLYQSICPDDTIHFGDLTYDLHLLKALIARSRMLISEESGAVALAQAFGVPALTPTQFATKSLADSCDLVDRHRVDSEESHPQAIAAGA